MQHYNYLSFFLNAVNHAIDKMWPTTIKNVLELARLVRGGPDERLIFEAKNRSL